MPDHAGLLEDTNPASKVDLTANYQSNQNDLGEDENPIHNTEKSNERA